MIKISSYYTLNPSEQFGPAFFINWYQKYLASSILMMPSNFALAAARGLQETDLNAEEIARKAMAIASDICVYTNGNLTVEVISK